MGPCTTDLFATLLKTSCPPAGQLEARSMNQNLSKQLLGTGVYAFQPFVLIGTEGENGTEHNSVSSTGVAELGMVPNNH